MDIIEINNLEIFAKHGVLPAEKELGQKFLISIKLYTELHSAGLSDCISGTIDYGMVCKFIEEVFTRETYNLIEAAAEYMARALLLRFRPQLKEVEITVKKPWAPIGIPVDYCGVTIHRKWHTAYLSLGSNMGDREAYIRLAINAFKEHKLCRVTKQSGVLETEPYGKTDQDSFLNAACVVKTLLRPEELLQLCHEIEEKANRVRTEKWGPRTLDVDIIFYDDIIIDTKEPSLIIPHVDMHNRLFVLEPLNEIAPGYIHPVYGTSVRNLYERIKGAQ